MTAARIALALALLLFGATVADAQTERILDFLSDVELQPDSRLEVTETIRFRVLGTQIRHGINRDFPTDYPGPGGSRSTTGFVLEDASLDGDAVPTQLSRLENGVRIRIGDPARLVPPGVHTYTIRYLTWWQVSFGPDEDGLDWNVTGNGWTWPIDRAELRLHGLDGLVWNNVRVFTGPQGSLAGDARIIARAPGFLDVFTTWSLFPHERLTVAATFRKACCNNPPGSRSQPIGQAIISRCFRAYWAWSRSASMSAGCSFTAWRAHPPSSSRNSRRRAAFLQPWSAS